MSTTNTDKSWYYYIRKTPKTYSIGLVDSSGVAPATDDLDIEVRYNEIPDLVNSNQEEIPIPSVHQHGFLMGCVYEILRMYGKNVISYKQDYENEIELAIARQNDLTAESMVIAPLDLRDDYGSARGGNTITGQQS